MFSAKTKSNQSSLTSGDIITNTLAVSGMRNDASCNYVVNYSPTTYEITYQQKGYLYYSNTTNQLIGDNAGGTSITFNTTNSSRNIPIFGLTYSGESLPITLGQPLTYPSLVGLRMTH